MKQIVLFFLSVCLYGISGAQNITALEYFIDADPGAGTGTAVTITAAASVTKTFDVSITAVADGFHTLSIRGKDANNKWSNTVTTLFYKLPASALTIPNINKMEYFIDADPGAGAGTNVAVTAGTSVTGLAVNVPITSVADGFHTISFRSRDANLKWSNTVTSLFYKLPAAVTTAPNLSKLEYFFDTDPGANSGSPITIAPATSLTNFIFDAVVGALSAGEHKLNVRALDANGKWSIVYTATVGIFGPAPAAQPTNAIFSAITTTSFTVAYTAPTTAPAGYVVVRKAGSAPTTDPVDGTTYAKENTLGDGKVAFVGTALTFTESGLLPETNYFYKIYAFNGSTTLTNYLTLAPLEGNTTTLPEPLAIVSEVFPATYNKGGTLTVSVTVNSASKASGVKIKYKGISDADADLKTATVTATGNKFEKIFSASELEDGIGMKYFFEVTSISTDLITTATHKSYVQYSATEPIPSLSFGAQVSNYQIVSVPLTLTNKNVTSVFGSLGTYDPTQWRLFDYKDGDNREYPNFTTIDPGKGYWLIARNSTTINPGVGTALSVDEANPFAITLAVGWNLIGNPYNFKISWTDVLAANSNPTGVSTSLSLFSGGVLSAGTELATYRGGFVNNTSAAPITLKIPVLRNKTINGGRIGSAEEIDLASTQWNIPISISNGELTNALGGVGMDPLATQSGMDNFDRASVSLVEGMDMPELDFSSSPLSVVFNKDVVPTQPNFTWQFKILNPGDAPMQIQWPTIERKGSHELMLYDIASQRVIDMTTQQVINISPQSNTFKIFFGDKAYIAQALDKELPVIGQPFPNPAHDELVNMPFYLTDALDNSNVSIKIYNTLGKEVALLADSKYGKGRHTVSWKPTEPTGLYIITMKVGTGNENRVRLVLK